MVRLYIRCAYNVDTAAARDILSAMPDDSKAELLRRLHTGRDVLLWKLDGLGEYDARRPLTPTGTNLLGIVKHVGIGAASYFGEVFGRRFPEPLLWDDESADPNADMYATAEESRDDVTSFYRRAWEHATATIEALPLDATGTVRWWPEERRHPTLHIVMVHVIAEVNRHAGHADIVRELIDGAVGLREGVSNLPEQDARAWTAHRARVEDAARRAAQ